MKFIGSLFIATAVAIVNISYMLSVKKKMQSLGLLIDMLIYIENRIEYLQKPLYDIISEYAEAKHNHFFAEVANNSGEGLTSAFDKALVLYNGEEVLFDENGKALIYEFASSAGKSGARGELKNTEVFRYKFIEANKLIKEKYNDKRKLLLISSVFFAVIITLIIL